MDSPTRSLDFALIFRLRADAPGAEALARGAASARIAFPSSGSIIRGRAWTPAPAVGGLLRERSVDGEPSRRATMADFMAEPMDPRRAAPFRQLLVHDEADGSTHLVTRIHHAAADLVAASMWATHQLAVASGRMGPATSPSPGPVLRTHPKPIRKSRFAHSGASRPMAAPGRHPSPRRHWSTLTLPAREIRAALPEDAGHSYNDLLSASALEALARWQALRGAPTGRLSLWFPINIRLEAFSGFGNGSGRIRVYRTWEADTPAVERARAVREQVAWARDHGEWAVPEDHALLRLPDWLMAPILRAYVNRPGVDMGTALFSHAERFGPASGSDEAFLPEVEDVDGVAPLDKRHVIGIAGATFRGRTRLTVTRDPGLLPDTEAEAFVALYEETLAEARAGLA